MNKYFKSRVILACACLSISSHLLAQTADQIADFTKAAQFDDVSEVKLLLAKGFNPNSVDKLLST